MPRCVFLLARSGPGTSDTSLAFAAAVRMVVGVHDGTADCRTDAHMALAAGLTDIDQIVIRIAHDANCGAACGHRVRSQQVS